MKTAWVFMPRLLKRMLKRLIALCFFFFIITPSYAREGDEYLTVFAGVGTSADLPELPEGDYHIEDSYFISIAYSKEFLNFEQAPVFGNISFELEGQVGRHFGMQNHFEFIAAALMRFNSFPWDDYIDTSFAIGDGLSYATSYPEIEIKYDNARQRLLNYLVFEIEFKKPESPWSFVSRIHHRSGVYGLFGDVEGGSNFLTIGVRKKF